MYLKSLFMVCTKSGCWEKSSCSKKAAHPFCGTEVGPRTSFLGPEWVKHTWFFVGNAGRKRERRRRLWTWSLTQPIFCSNSPFIRPVRGLSVHFLVSRSRPAEACGRRNESIKVTSDVCGLHPVRRSQVSLSTTMLGSNRGRANYSADKMILDLEMIPAHHSWTLVAYPVFHRCYGRSNTPFKKFNEIFRSLLSKEKILA